MTNIICVSHSERGGKLLIKQIISHFCHGAILQKSIGFSAALLLDNVDKYRFLSNGRINLPGVEDAAEFQSTIRAMKIMGFQDEEITCEFPLTQTIFVCEENQQDSAVAKATEEFHTNKSRQSLVIGICT